MITNIVAQTHIKIINKYREDDCVFMCLWPNIGVLQCLWSEEEHVRKTDMKNQLISPLK